MCTPSLLPLTRIRTDLELCCNCCDSFISLIYDPTDNFTDWVITPANVGTSCSSGRQPCLRPSLHHCHFSPSLQRLSSTSRGCGSTNSGGFDAPREKCPPDIHPGGSLNEVTARSAQHSSSLSLLQTQSNRQQQQQHIPNSYPPKNLTPHYHHQQHGLVLPKKSHSTGSITSSTAERAIISRPFTAPRSPLGDLGGFASSFQRPSPNGRVSSGTPPLTPPSSTPGSSLGELVSGSRHSTTSAVDIPQVKKATKVINGFTISISVGQSHPLETPPSTPDVASGSNSIADWVSQDLQFLKEIFPTATRALPYAKSVEITQDGMTWDGFVLELPGRPKTLYVCGRGAEKVQLRER